MVAIALHQLEVEADQMVVGGWGDISIFIYPHSVNQENCVVTVKPFKVYKHRKVSESVGLTLTKNLFIFLIKKIKIKEIQGMQKS